jgi:hypothetical protein
MSRVASTLAACVIAATFALADASATAYRQASGRPVVLVVDDPCDPCQPHRVSVCVPICSVEAPCVTWRNGLLGRRIATYVWPTGYRVEVVVTRRGDVIVR